MAVKPGDILRDKYRIDALIGRGGMGQVFAATDLQSTSRSQVAIKVVSRLLVDEIMMMRLHREAIAAQRVRSDFVPAVLQVSDTDDGETFLVMERLVGEPLSQRIRDNGALPWTEVSRIGEDILRGLIDAHAAGIIHRDLKPSNIFLALKAGRLRAMILDFGVCKMEGLDAERLTGTGESIGTVAYMAPEQIRGAARVDERADLYAFGVLVFEMLCGRLPHEGPSQMAILASKLENRPARLRDCSRVSVPHGASEIVMRLLERDPEYRFSSAHELLRAWRAFTKPSEPSVSNSADSTNELETTVGGDAITEVSTRSIPIPAIHAQAQAHAYQEPNDGLETEEDLTDAAASARELLDSAELIPIEQHPTQITLTTHTTVGKRSRSNARVAIFLAFCALLGGTVVMAISLFRTPPPPKARTAAATTVASTPVVAPPSTSAEAPPAESATIDLPADPPAAEPSTTSSVARPHPRPVHVVHPAPAPAPAPVKPPEPKSSGPRITPQPRY